MHYLYEFVQSNLVLVLSLQNENFYAIKKISYSDLYYLTDTSKGALEPMIVEFFSSTLVILILTFEKLLAVVKHAFLSSFRFILLKKD